MAREEKGLRGYQLAEMVGSDSGALSRWETGARRPRGETVRRLANVLGVRMEWLLTGEEPRSPVAHGAIVTRLVGVAALDHVLADFAYPPTLPTETVDEIEALAYEEAAGVGASRTPAAWRHRLGALCTKYADSRTRTRAR